jgi:cell division protein ZapA
MGKVRVEIGGRTYPLSCSDGEESHLSALADYLAAKADELTAAIGTMSEPRLLLMAGIQVADELFAVRQGGEQFVRDDASLAALLARLEAVAEALDRG